MTDNQTPTAVIDPEQQRRADQAWAKLMQDREFVEAIPEPVRNVIREMLGDVVATLAPHQDTPVTLASFVAAKVAVAKTLFTQHYLDRMMNVIPAELAGQRDQIVASGKQREQRVLASYAQAVTDLETQPEGTVTRDLFRFHAELDTLEDAAAAELATGTLTIGRLLDLQPQVFLAHG